MERRTAGLATLVGLAMGARAVAGGLTLDSAGARGGFSAKGSKLSFYQTEAFADWNLPWRWAPESGFRLQTKLDASAGWINGRGDHAFVGTAGPMCSLGWRDFPLRLDCGSNPTILTRDEFGKTDLGIPFQFTSYGQLIYQWGGRLAIGYRYQHMSNANIADANPGVNMHMLSIGYRF